MCTINLYLTKLPIENHISINILVIGYYISIKLLVKYQYLYANIMHDILLSNIVLSINDLYSLTFCVQLTDI